MSTAAPWERRTQFDRMEVEEFDRSVAKTAGVPNRCEATKVVARG